MSSSKFKVQGSKFKVQSSKSQDPRTEFKWGNGNKKIHVRFERLDLEQTIEILKIFSNYDVTSIEELLNCNLKSLYNDIVSQELIYPLLKAILKPVNCELMIDDIKRMPPEYIRDIWDGFFFYYPKVKDGLLNTFAAIGSYLAAPEKKKGSRLRLSELFTSSRTGIS